MKIKIAVAISILSFFILATATLASYFVIKERNEHNPDLLSNIQSENSSPAPTSEPSSLTPVKISGHSTATDCWIIISGKVYNVTKFLDLHPGGGFTIIPYCGKDATNAFNTRDRKPPQTHSNLATEILTQYLIGNLGAAIQNSTPSVVNVPQIQKTATTLPKIVPIVQTTQPPLQTSSVTLSTAEVATHNTTSNCWLIISNNIYNVTNYLVAHPGGVSAISPYCGKEATQAFQTRGGRGSNHSSTAYNLLNNYLVGSIGSTITTSNTSSNTSGSSSSPTTTPNTQGVGTNNNAGGNGSMPAAVQSKYPNSTIKSIEDNGREMEIITSQGTCRHIKLNTNGSIQSDQNC